MVKPSETDFYDLLKNDGLNINQKVAAQFDVLMDPSNYLE